MRPAAHTQQKRTKVYPPLWGFHLGMQMKISDLLTFFYLLLSCQILKKKIGMALAGYGHTCFWTFLLSYFRGCWLLDFSCAQSMWTYNEAAIELAAAVFCKRLQEHQAMSFVTKLNSWRRKHYKIRLDSFLYLSGFTAKINTTVCSSRLFSTDLERHLSTS